MTWGRSGSLGHLTVNLEHKNRHKFFYYTCCVPNSFTVCPEYFIPLTPLDLGLVCFETSQSSYTLYGFHPVDIRHQPISRFCQIASENY